MNTKLKLMFSLSGFGRVLLTLQCFITAHANIHAYSLRGWIMDEPVKRIHSWN